MQFGIVMVVSSERATLISYAARSSLRHHPEAAMTVIADGVDRSGVPLHGARYVQGENLKRLDLAGEWWGRWMRCALDLPGKYLVKIDPDTRCNRRVRDWPDLPLFGCIGWPGLPAEHVQGGCQVFRRDTIERILASGILTDRRLFHPEVYAPTPEEAAEFRRANYFSSDFSLAWICRELGIPIADWGEAKCRGRTPPPDAGEGAFSHPHKKSPICV